MGMLQELAHSGISAAGVDSASTSSLHGWLDWPPLHFTVLCCSHKHLKEQLCLSLKSSGWRAEPLTHLKEQRGSEFCALGCGNCSGSFYRLCDFGQVLDMSERVVGNDIASSICCLPIVSCHKWIKEGKGTGGACTMLSAKFQHIYVPMCHRQPFLIYIVYTNSLAI